MFRQIRLLTKISLCNLFGFNEFRFSKDEKKKGRYLLLGVLWCFLLILFAGYLAAMCYGLITMQMGEMVPAVITLGISMVTFIFTMMKAGPFLFDRGAYEKQIALPVHTGSIIVSRFLTMYATDMLFGMVMMAAGMWVYSAMLQPPAAFYLYGILGSILIPLLPLTVASVAGALITGITSRWRGKNMASTILTIGFVCAVVIGNFRISSMRGEEFKEWMGGLAAIMSGQIKSIYPPALWLSEAMVYGQGGRFVLFAAVSAGVFLIFLAVLQRYYARICSLLGVNAAKRDFRMKRLRAGSIMRSMVQRELRHYFSSTIYVTNTLIGEIMMVLASAAVLFVGKEQVESMIGMPGILEKAAPVLLGMLPAMMPATASAISIEGKQWWLMQTLPVTEKMVLRSKVWANIVVAFPFYVVSVVLMLIALRPGIAGTLGLIIVPMVYIVVSAWAGILLNRRFPVFDWDNEARVVKQSASCLLMSLIGTAMGVVPLVVVCL